MSKKKLDVMAEERKNFIYGIEDKNGNVLVPGCVRNGIDEASANKIYDEMAEFAKYAFNKSHAACYAVVAYRTAYLKYYYPSEFYASLLNSIIGSQNKVSYYILDCKLRNIKIIRPNVNRSFARFSVEGNDIVFGLAAIKNVGEAAINAITDEREKNGKYKNFIDFCERIASEQVNKKCIESLIKAGAFDDIDEHNRGTILCSFETIINQVTQDKRKGLSGQMNIFDIGLKEDEKKSLYTFIDRDELPKTELLSMEKDVLGFYVSGHPLDQYRDKIVKISNVNSMDFLPNDDELDIGNEESVSNEDVIKDGDFVKVVGLISDVKTKITKAGDMMAFLNLEDLDGQIPVIVFAKTFSVYKNLLFEDAIVYIEGRANVKENDEPSLVAMKITLVDGEDSLDKILEDNLPEEEKNKIKMNFEKNNLVSKAISLANSKNKKLKINIPDGLSEEQLQDLRNYIKMMGNQKTNTNCIIINKDKAKEMNLFVSREILDGLYNKIGEENVKFE